MRSSSLGWSSSSPDARRQAFLTRRLHWLRAPQVSPRPAESACGGFHPTRRVSAPRRGLGSMRLSRFFETTSVSRWMWALRPASRPPISPPQEVDKSGRSSPGGTSDKGAYRFWHGTVARQSSEWSPCPVGCCRLDEPSMPPASGWECSPVDRAPCRSLRSTPKCAVGHKLERRPGVRYLALSCHLPCRRSS
jgi:hypothetical protein